MVRLYREVEIYNIILDKFCKNTTAAIKKFQEDKGLTVDGILGANTKEELGI